MNIDLDRFEMAQKFDGTTHFEDAIALAIDYPPVDTSFTSIHDDVQKGLLCRVYRSGHAAYYCYIYDATVKKKTYEKIADFDSLSVTKARRTVADRIEGVANKTADNESYLLDKQQQTEKRKSETKRSTITLRSAIESYIGTKGLADDSVRDYRNTLSSTRNSADILDDPITSITPDWFKSRFKKIYDRSPAIAHKWRRYLNAVLTATNDSHPDLFTGKLPVASKRSLSNYKSPGRKSNRLEASHFPKLRAKLLEADDYDRDYLLIMLFTGMRSGAVMRLRYDMTCERKNKEEWQQGIISVYDATEKRPAVNLVVSDHVRQIIIKRQKKYGKVSPWLFWSRRFHGKYPEKHCGDDRDVFERLGLNDNFDEQLSAHDLRRTNSYVARAILRIDPVIVARLHLQSINNMSVPDGYVSASDVDLRRETNRISGKIHDWMKSTPELIEKEVSGRDAKADMPTFEL